MVTDVLWWLCTCWVRTFSLLLSRMLQMIKLTLVERELVLMLFSLIQTLGLTEILIISCYLYHLLVAPNSNVYSADPRNCGLLLWVFVVSLSTTFFLILGVPFLTHPSCRKFSTPLSTFPILLSAPVNLCNSLLWCKSGSKLRYKEEFILVLIWCIFCH